MITPDLAPATEAQNAPSSPALPSTTSTPPSIEASAGPTDGTRAVVTAATTDSGPAPTVSVDGTPGQTVGRPDTDPAEPTTAASADTHRADAAWADAVLPVLEMQLSRLSQEQTAPEVAGVRATVARLAALVEEARQAGELPPTSVTQALVSATPLQMQTWQGTAQVHAAAQAAAARSTDDPATRARHWLTSVLYQGFPMQTGARNLNPERLTDADFLPLVQQVLDPSVSKVDPSHLGRLNAHVETLVGRGNPVTLDALSRREGFEVLRQRLDDRPLGDDADAVLELDRRIAQVLGARGVASDRQLELRGLARDLVAAKLGIDPTEQNLVTLNQVVELAYRRYLKTNDGAVPAGPLRLSHVQDLLQHKLGDRGTLAWDNLQRVVDQATARQQWRDRHPLLAQGGGVVRSLTATRPALRETGVYRSVVDRHTRRIERQAGQADSPDQRRHELENLWEVMSPVTSAGASASTSLDPEGITRSDVARLVDTRRRLYADSRFRWYSDPSDYRSMALELLGAGRVGPAEIRQLTTMVRTARPNTRTLRTDLRSVERYSDSVLRRRLTELATAQWQDGKPGARPTVPGVVGDHSRLVTAFHSIGKLTFVPELTTWLNHSVPFGTGAVTEEVVSRTLASQFGQVLDEGAALSAMVDGRTYDIRLWAVATGEPVVKEGSLLGVKEPDSTRFSGKQEKRIYRYRDTATWQTSTHGLSVDAGVAYRGDVGVSDEISAARLDAGAAVGGMKTWGHRQLAANTTADYLQFRIKEPLGWTHLPVGWVVRVQDRQTGRWRELTLQDEHGTLREDLVPYAVAQFQLPFPAPNDQTQRSNPGHRGTMDPNYLTEVEVSTAEQFPVWDLDHGVPRVQLADSVLTEMRQILSPDDYAFWKPVVEAYVTNDQLALSLGDILRPRERGTFQQEFRHVLQRDGRHLSFSLTAADQARPISTVTKISEVSRSGETRFDQVLAIVSKTLLSQDATRSARGTVTGAARLFDQVLRIGGRGQHTRRTGTQAIRHHRGMLYRSKRVGGGVQNVLADFTVRLDVHHRRGDEPPVSGSKEISGFAHFMLHAADLRALPGMPPGWAEAGTEAHRAADRAEDTQLARDADPDRARKWWTPGSRFGLTMDFVERLDGVSGLYSEIATVMAANGYLPPESVRPTGAPAAPGRTPWDLLQELAVTGADLNRPGQAWANWRTLLSQSSEQALRARADDVLTADAGQPGVAWTFPAPIAPADPARLLTIGIWAEADGAASTHQGITKYQVQYGHTSIDTMAVKGARSRVTDGSGYLGAGGTTADGSTGQFQFGGEGSLSSTDKLGRTQSTSVTSDTDGQKMPSSRYRVPIQWHWFAERGPVPVGSGAVPGSAVLLQPDVLHVAAHDAPLPDLVIAPESPSVLTTMGAAIYTVIGVQGVGVMQQALIGELPDLPKATVWQGLTPTVYKSAVMRALTGAATIPIGDRTVGLATQPVGRPQIVKVWFPYTQQVQESQVGHEQGGETLTQRGRQVQGTGGLSALGPDGSGLFAGSGAATRSHGTGESSASMYTVGSYRGVYQDTRMAIVRTAVVNRLTVDGRTVEATGEVLLNVLLTDVLAQRDGFDGTGLLDGYDSPTTQQATPSVPPALSSDLAPPASLRDGLSGAAVWPILFGDGGVGTGFAALTRQLARQAADFGEPDLVTQIQSLPSGLGPYLPKMRDDGAAWTFKAGGRTFELHLSAELVGPARDSRPGGTGEKIYERGNAYQDASRRNVTSDRLTVGLTGAGRPGETDGYLGLAVTESRTVRVDQADTRGSNLLFMTGLRANKLTDFTQAVEFTATIVEIVGLRTRIADGMGRLLKDMLGREAPVRLAVIRAVGDQVVTVPTEGTVPNRAPRTDLGIGLRNLLPATHRIEGMVGLRAIIDALQESGRGQALDLATVPPAVDRLTFETMRDSLAAMLSPGGARFRSVASQGEVWDFGSSGFRVHARFGPVGQLYYMAKAELENYDHGTDLVAHSRGENTRDNLTGTLTLGFEVAPGQRVGPQFSVGGERGRTVGADQTTWTESRAWLRADTSVFFIYAALEFTISLPGSNRPPLARSGGVELVVDRQGALDLGVPAGVLSSVVPTATPSQELPGRSGAQPPEAGSVDTPSGRLEQIARGYETASRDIARILEPGPVSAVADGPTTATSPTTAVPVATTLPTAAVPTSMSPAAAVPTAVPAGLALVDPADHVHLTAAQSFPAVPGRYLVFVHGSPDALIVGEHRIGAAQLAEMIQDDPGWQGRPVVLVACATAADLGNGFATQLANLLPGTPVSAPSTTVWTTATGQTVATEASYDADGTPRLTNPTGRWHTIQATTAPGTPTPVNRHTELGPYLPDTPSVPQASSSTPGQGLVSWTNSPGADPASLVGDTPGSRQTVRENVELLGQLAAHINAAHGELRQAVERIDNAPQRAGEIMADLQELSAEHASLHKETEQAIVDASQSLADVRQSIAAVLREQYLADATPQAAAVAQRAAAAMSMVNDLALQAGVGISEIRAANRGFQDLSVPALQAISNAAGSPGTITGASLSTWSRLETVFFRWTLTAQAATANADRPTSDVVSQLDDDLPDVAGSTGHREADLANAMQEAAGILAEISAWAELARTSAGRVDENITSARHHLALLHEQHQSSKLALDWVLSASITAQDLARSLPATARVQHIVPAGVALYDAVTDPAYLTTARSFPPMPDSYLVFSHDDSADILTLGEEHTSPERLAEFIRWDPAWQQRPIILVRDHAATDGYAARLASLLPGTPVTANIADVWFTAEGHLHSDDPDSWQTFHTPTTAASPTAAVPTTVPAGMALVDPGDPVHLTAAQSFPAVPGRFLVFVHGSPDAFHYGQQRIDVAQLAQMVRAHPDWQGRPVVLISCRTGVDLDNGPAIRLAKLLPNIPVTAPDTIVWTTPTGQAVATEASYDADGTPHFTNPGRWHTIRANTAAPAAGADPVTTAPGTPTPVTVSTEPGPYLLDTPSVPQASSSSAPVQGPFSWTNSPGADQGWLVGDTPGSRQTVRENADRLWQLTQRINATHGELRQAVERIDNAPQEAAEIMSDLQALTTDLASTPDIAEQATIDASQSLADIRQSIATVLQVQQTAEVRHRPVDVAEQAGAVISTVNDLTSQARRGIAELREAHRTLQDLTTGTLQAISDAMKDPGTITGTDLSRWSELETILSRWALMGDVATIDADRAADGTGSEPNDSFPDHARAVNDWGIALTDALHEAEGTLVELVGWTELARLSAGRVDENITSARRQLALLREQHRSAELAFGGVLSASIAAGQLAQSLPVAARVQHTVRAGVALVDPGTDPAYLAAAQSFPPVPGHYLVFTHDGATALTLGEEHNSPERLAEIIQSDPAWQQRQIVLVLDHAANGFAARLAGLLPGTPVTATDGEVRFTADGRLTSDDPDSWHTFRTPAPTDIFQDTAVGHAPTTHPPLLLDLPAPTLLFPEPASAGRTPVLAVRQTAHQGGEDLRQEQDVSHPSDLTDEQWRHALRTLTPVRGPDNRRRQLNGMLFRLANKVAWKDLPPPFQPWQGISTAYYKWGRHVIEELPPAGIGPARPGQIAPGHYPSDLTDEQWQRIKPMLPGFQQRSNEPLRAVVNAILYRIENNLPRWTDLPSHFPAPRNVDKYVAQWNQQNLLVPLLETLGVDWTKNQIPSRPHPQNLTDEQWQRVRPLLPQQVHLLRRYSDRALLDGALYLVRNRHPRQLPENFPPKSTIERHLRSWGGTPFVRRLLDQLQDPAAGRQPPPDPTTRMDETW
ncbi:transposase [Micromonospora echinofusca]|uniref:Transposase n=1 Tax=Micromonospora echinofusca TaxID=47858 RepID=A0ABS3VTM6_MICEH|nr:transposase [Micromonospora echinofusca]MBO4207855.1 transposase [Micromonospora echinofusca]